MTQLCQREDSVPERILGWAWAPDENGLELNGIEFLYRWDWLVGSGWNHQEGGGTQLCRLWDSDSTEY